ncbi:MAG TPA: sulfate ABC transporter permease subunit CysT [Dongiaceae bacterium]|jgi:sulfate transport system permease protein|nr:sulfate ABC transporter permease subunit CysT [Dongiaceae bacterium]
MKSIPAFFRRPSALPGFSLTFGIAMTYLSLLVVLPLSALATHASGQGVAGILKTLADPRVLAALKLSFGLSLLAAYADMILGILLAWALTRYRFWLRPLVDALVDLPFALPTAVAGIALTQLYSPGGWMGRLLGAIGIKVAFTPLGILLAMMFVGLPFAVRSVQPVIEDWDRETEESALTMGAGWGRYLWQIVLPTLAPAAITAFGLAFARAVGEYGSIIFIAGNLPLKTEIAPLLIVAKLEQFDYTGAAIIACVMMVLSLAILGVVGLLNRYFTRYLR